MLLAKVVNAMRSAVAVVGLPFPLVGDTELGEDGWLFLHQRCLVFAFETGSEGFQGQGGVFQDHLICKRQRPDVSPVQLLVNEATEGRLRIPVIKSDGKL